MANQIIDQVAAIKLEEMDFEVYGPGVYDWADLPEHVAIRMVGDGEGFFSYRFKGTVIEIEKIVIRQDLRRQGRGTQVIRWLVQRAIDKGKTVLRITIPESNLIGSKFLARLGFTSRLIKHGFIEFTRPIRT
jgi:GNAT superfamily N-acetyltransferase